MAEVTDPTVPVPLPAPWERQPDEGDEAWLAFRAYRDMPPERRRISRALDVRNITLSEWYRKHNWSDRVKAWDAKMDTMHREEREAIYRRSSKELAMDHMMILADMKDIVSEEFRKLRKASSENDMHGLIRTGDLIKLAEQMVKLERLIQGQTTDNVGHTDLDLSKLSIAEVEQLHAIMAKAGMKTEA